MRTSSVLCAGWSSDFGNQYAPASAGCGRSGGMDGAERMQGNVRLTEVVASLCLATDLAIGQPLEHGLRRCLLARWLGEELGLGAEELSAVYYTALLGAVGCTLEDAAYAEYFA